MPIARRPDRWILAWLAQTATRMTGGIADPSDPTLTSQVTIPTRYGQMSALIYDSPERDRGRTRPLHIQIHGGGLIGRGIREDEHVCRFHAAETGCTVLSLHYHAAPQVTFPVAEHECFDALRWALDSADVHGWDGRITVGGGSTGAKLAVNVAQQAYDHGIPLAGVVLSSPLLDLTHNDRETDREKPRWGPRLLEFIADTYVPDTLTRFQPLASPSFDLALVKKLPPALIQVGSEDWLAGDGEDLAARLVRAHKPHTLTHYPAGHHLTVRGEADVRAEALAEQSRFITGLYR